MKAKQFKHSNTVYAKDQPEFSPLPALKFETETGEVVFCMGLNFWERLRVLFLGKIWVSLRMYGKPLTPSFHSTYRTDVYSLPYDWSRDKMEWFNHYIKRLWSRKRKT